MLPALCTYVCKLFAEYQFPSWRIFHLASNSSKFHLKPLPMKAVKLCVRNVRPLQKMPQECERTLQAGAEGRGASRIRQRRPNSKCLIISKWLSETCVIWPSEQPHKPLPSLMEVPITSMHQIFIEHLICTSVWYPHKSQGLYSRRAQGWKGRQIMKTNK